jgi:hypothetical protein
VEVGGGGAETDVVRAGAAVVEVDGGGAKADAVRAGPAAVRVGRGGAETDAVVAGAAGSDAVTFAPGVSLRDNSRLRPTPTAMERRIVRTVPNGVSIAPIKFLAQSILLFTVIVIGGGSVPPCSFSTLIIAA